MWLLSSDDYKTLHHTLESVCKVVLNDRQLNKWNLVFIPIWEPPGPKSPSDRVEPKLPEPLSR